MVGGIVTPETTTGPGSLAPARFSLRPATPADFPALLRLNAEWEHVTSPLDEQGLEHLYTQAEYLHVVDTATDLAGFLLAFRAGARYDSPNYRWFDSRSQDFLYVDRIVIAGAFQRCGLGDALYDDALEYARGHSIPRIVCEVDVEPLNRASDAFHRRRGFVELATQWIADGNKQVSLRECAINAG